MCSTTSAPALRTTAASVHSPPLLLDRGTHTGLHLLVCALALGAAGDYLLRAAWGLNAALWFGGLGLAAVVLVRRWQRPPAADYRWLLLPLTLLASTFVWRAAPMLLFANALMIVTLLGWCIQRTQAAHRRAEEPFPREPGLLASTLRSTLGFPAYLLRAVDWKQLQSEERRQTLGAVVRGLLLGLPVAAVFTLLLTAADTAFADLVTGMVDLEWRLLPGHALLTVLLAWLAGGLLRGLVVQLPTGRSPAAASSEAAADAEIRPGAARTAPAEVRGARLGATEATTVLVLVNTVFAAFMLVQLRYLFGGTGLVTTTADLTLATYARHGFFELTTVATISLPILLAMHQRLATPTPAQKQRIRLLTYAQLGLLMGVLASAAQRMWLYQASFGLTALRVYVGATLVWLAAVLVWFGWTVVRGRSGRFLPGAIAAAVVVVLGLNAVNPHALVARVNVERAIEGRPFDAAYAASLSSDAVPVLLNALPDLPMRHRRALERGLAVRHSAATASGLDWRSWNLARSRAAAARAAALSN